MQVHPAMCMKTKHPRKMRSTSEIVRNLCPKHPSSRRFMSPSIAGRALAERPRDEQKSPLASQHRPVAPGTPPVASPSMERRFFLLFDDHLRKISEAPIARPQET
jgi:hypothetical protein